jgi:hypothetical protein
MQVQKKISRMTSISPFTLRPPKKISQDTSRKNIFCSSLLNSILFHCLPWHLSLPLLQLHLVQLQLPQLHLKKTLQLGFNASTWLMMNSRNSGTCNRKNLRHVIHFSGGKEEKRNFQTFIAIFSIPCKFYLICINCIL